MAAHYVRRLLVGVHAAYQPAYRPPTASAAAARASLVRLLESRYTPLAALPPRQREELLSPPAAMCLGSNNAMTEVP
jgi:hypothetical protein